MSIEDNKKQLNDAISELNKMDSDVFGKLVEDQIGEDGITLIIDYLSEFYGIDDDEDLGMLAQIFLTGYFSGNKSFSKLN